MDSEGRSNRAQPFPAYSEKLPKWHFLTPAWNLVFCGPNEFIWSAKEVPFRDFTNNMSQASSKCFSKWIKVDQWDSLKNPSHKFKKSFCSGFQWIPRKTGRPHFFKVRSGRTVFVVHTYTMFQSWGHLIRATRALNQTFNQIPSSLKKIH